MADQPTPAKKPRTAASPVRGFLNMSAALPDFGAVSQSENEIRGNRGCLGYGSGNTVPVVALAAAHASGTAYRCLERRAQFLEGTGFAAPLGDEQVPGHPGKTANDFWAELCSYGSYHNGAAVLVRYTNAYVIGEVHILPFGAVRKTNSGTYLLNHKFGRKGYRASDTTEHLPFNPDPKVVKQEIKDAQKLAAEKKKPYVQLGQIFYIYTPKAGEEDYPLPPHWAGLDAVLTDAAYANFDLTEVRRGFMAKGILAMIGELDDEVQDEHGMTELDRQNELLRSYTVQGAADQGEERESILVMGAKTQDAVPRWIPMNTTTDLKWLSDKKEAVGQEVCRHIGMPPILVGFAKAGQLGAVQEIINATQLTQNSLEPLRKLLTRATWRLLPALQGQVPGKLAPLDVATAVTPAAHA